MLSCSLSQGTQGKMPGHSKEGHPQGSSGTDLSVLSYKQGSSHSSDKSPIASALELAVHHRHHLAASGKIPEQGIEIHIPEKQL